MDGQQPTNAQPDEPQPFKPGDTIVPATTSPQPAVFTPEVSPSPTVPSAVEPKIPLTSEVQAESHVPAAATESSAEPAPRQAEPDEAPAWQPDTSDDTLPQSQGDQGMISWTASEFIAHDKSASWYGALALGALVLATIVYLLTRDKISTGVVLVAGLALGFYGARKPQQLQYELNEQGVRIGQKFYAYSQFRSFAFIDEGAFSSISFTPLNRFGQLVTIYFDPKDGERIADLLADRLPLENRQHDVVDRFMKRIRF